MLEDVKKQMIMKRDFLRLLDSWPKDYITSTDVRFILPGSVNAIHSLIKRCRKEGILIKIRRDLFLIAKKIKEIRPNAFELASIIYGPSYVSLESALNFHGWIPESVPLITCATSKRSKYYNTQIGEFQYYAIPIKLFHIGIDFIEIEKSKMIIANPWKAVADLIYVKKRSWLNIFSFSNDMRIELDVLQSSDINLLNALAKKYPSKRVQLTLTKFSKDLDNGFRYS